jgi:putative ABC transport system permease protein
MVRYIPLILKNCWRNRRRTILTILSIGVSMCLLGVMISLYHAFFLSDPTPDQARRLVVRNKISLAQPMPLAFQRRIEQTPGVQSAMIANWFGGTYKDNRDPKNQFARFAVEPEKLFTVYSEAKISESEKQAWFKDRAGCVIGREVQVAHNLKVGDKLHITGDIYPGDFEFTIDGVFDLPGPSQVMYFNKEYLEQAMSERRRGNVGMFYVRIDDPAKSAPIANTIDEMFRNGTAQTKTESEQAFVVGFLSFLGNVKVMLMSFAGAVMFTVLLVSANTMAMSVRERVREVGVLKTLGFTNGAILGMVLGEACAISVIGGAIGYAISMLLMQGVVASPMGGFLPSYKTFEPLVALVCVVSAAAIGVCSSLVPALGASRIPIVAALRRAD